MARYIKCNRCGYQQEIGSGVKLSIAEYSLNKFGEDTPYRQATSSDRALSDLCCSCARDVAEFMMKKIPVGQ